MKEHSALESILDSLADRVAERVQNKAMSAPCQANIEPRLYSVEQAASYLNRSPHSVRHLITTKKLRAVKLDGRVFLDKNDLDRAIDEAKL
jgi:excisionase family DNA binding protein